LCSTSTFQIGEAQVVSDVNYFNETVEILIQTATYMKDIVMGSSTSYYPVRATCRNMDSQCSEWATQGYCHPDHTEFQFMIENCAPACQICHLQDCNQQPELFLKEGDVNIMFERIVGEQALTDYQIEKGMSDIVKHLTIHSRPIPSWIDDDEEYPYLIGGPWIITIDDFLSPEECDFLIEMGHKSGYSRSTETNTNGTDFESKFRTSSNTWCRRDCKNHPLTQRIFEKMNIVTGLPMSHAELIQLLRYEPGEFYRSHHDFVSPHLRRVLTFFLYLEDEGLEGGGTRFTNLFPDEEDDEPVSLEVNPKKGRALIWPNVLNDNPMEKDFSTYHEGMSVEQGVKYAANVWFHNYDLSKGYNLDC
jgi:prolyl 4-hydroxylase